MCAWPAGVCVEKSAVYAGHRTHVSACVFVCCAWTKLSSECVGFVGCVDVVDSTGLCAACLDCGGGGGGVLEFVEAVFVAVQWAGFETMNAGDDHMPCGIVAVVQ